MSDASTLESGSLEAMVPDAEFARHLGYDDAVIPHGESRNVADRARSWFKENGRPFHASRSLAVQGITDSCVILAGDVQLHSRILAERFSAAGVHAVHILGVSAGRELDEEVQRQWASDRPDAAYALSAFGAAFTETLVRTESAALCEQADVRGETLLAHFSPGYEDWDTVEQRVLMTLLKETHPDLPLEALPSSLLVPQKSQLAVLGVTRHKDRVQRNLIPCTGCSLNPCRLRRAPYREGRVPEELPVVEPAGAPGYAFPENALRRWSKRYLALAPGEDGICATFTYEGSTCSDGGIPLVFVYQADLKPIDGGYEIRDLSCRPLDGDRGHVFMCSFKTEADAVRQRIESFKPLLGQPLSDALQWTPSRNPAGCLCSQANRNHKWLMALQTMHYAIYEMKEGEGSP